MEMVESLKNRQLSGLKEMKNYLQYEGCRFRFLQNYFGEGFTTSECGHCDSFYRKEGEDMKKVKEWAIRLYDEISEDGLDVVRYVVRSENESLARESIRFLYRRRQIKYVSGKVFKQ